MAKKTINWKSLKSNRITKDFKRLPTGIFQLDYALGGGFPIGVTSNLFGADHSFKTGILLKLVSTAQNWCWSCNNYVWDCKCESGPTKKEILFLDLETVDWEWAERLGVDTSDKALYIEEPEYGEEVVDIVYAALKDEDVGLVIVDSISRILPKEETDGLAGDYKVGIRAKLHTQMINKVKSALIYRKKIDSPVLFVGTTQVRANIGGNMYYGEAIESSASYALKHDWHLSLKTVKLAPEVENNIPHYGRFKVVISSLKTKSKMYVLGSEARFNVVLQPIDDEIERMGEVLDYGDFLRVAKEQIMTKKYEIYDVSFKYQRDIVPFMRENSNKYLSLKKKLIEHCVGVAKGKIPKIPNTLGAKADKDTTKEE